MSWYAFHGRYVPNKSDCLSLHLLVFWQQKLYFINKLHWVAVEVLTLLGWLGWFEPSSTIPHQHCCSLHSWHEMYVISLYGHYGIRSPKRGSVWINRFLEEGVNVMRCLGLFLESDCLRVIQRFKTETRQTGCDGDHAGERMKSSCWDGFRGFDEETERRRFIIYQCRNLWRGGTYSWVESLRGDK